MGVSDPLTSIYDDCVDSIRKRDIFTTESSKTRLLLLLLLLASEGGATLMSYAAKCRHVAGLRHRRKRTSTASRNRKFKLKHFTETKGD